MENPGNQSGESAGLVEDPPPTATATQDQSTSESYSQPQQNQPRPPPPLSPLTGCYLLVVVGEPHSERHKEIILQKIAKAFLSWDINECHVSLEKELQVITGQSPEGEEARFGERLIQYATENLVTEILIHPQLNTLHQCMKNLLSSFTKHRHIIHAGYTFAGNGSWILQDGTLSISDLVEALHEPEVLRVLKAYENSVSIDVHCAPEGDWTTERFQKEPVSKLCNIRINPGDVMTAGNPAISAFIDYLSPFLEPANIQQLLQPTDVVGNIRFTHPTLYVFPGGQGDAALFGINGFNMLIDGGFARKACFWDFARHLDRLDAVLLTRLNNSTVNGISAVLQRKKMNHVYPQIGHFFCNLQDRKIALSPDGDKDKDSLIVNLAEEGQEIVANLRHLALKPHPCYRDGNQVDPVNLYHKVGHGKLDMYVISPARDSQAVKEFLAKWSSNDSHLFSQTGKKVAGKAFEFPLQNLVSICALLVWQPANPNDTITRILFPGSTPQHKIFEGLEKLRHLEFLKHPVCCAKSISPSASTITISRSVSKTRQSKVVDNKQKETKVISKPQVKLIKPKLEKTPSKDIKPKLDTNKLADEKNELETLKESVKKVENGEEPLKKLDNRILSKDEQIENIKKEIQKIEQAENEEQRKKIVHRSKYDMRFVKSKVDSRAPSKSIDRKKLPEKKADGETSPTATPKKGVTNGTATKAEKARAGVKSAKAPSPVSTPAKSAKEANNRKVVEARVSSRSSSKSLTRKKEETPPPPASTAAKTERKPISRRPKSSFSPVRTSAGKPSKIEPESIAKKLLKPDIDSTVVKAVSQTISKELEKGSVTEKTEIEEKKDRVIEIKKLEAETENKETDEKAVKNDLESAHVEESNKKEEEDEEEEVEEEEEYLIVTKEESTEESAKEDEVEEEAQTKDETEGEGEMKKLLREEEESEKKRETVERIDTENEKVEETAQKLVKLEEKESDNATGEKERQKETKSNTSEEKIPEERESEFQKLLEVDEGIDLKEPVSKEHKEGESLPEEKISNTLETSATTAPTLPEDERIEELIEEAKEQAEEIKEVVEEKYIQEKTKEDKRDEDMKKPEQPNLPSTADGDVVQGFPVSVPIAQKKPRDVVKTPDEVADLPMHEEVDPRMYSSGEFTKDLQKKQDDKSDIKEKVEESADGFESGELKKDSPEENEQQEEGKNVKDSVTSKYLNIIDELEKTSDKTSESKEEFLPRGEKVDEVEKPEELKTDGRKPSLPADRVDEVQVQVGKESPENTTPADLSKQKAPQDVTTEISPKGFPVVDDAEKQSGKSTPVDHEKDTLHELRKNLSPTVAPSMGSSGASTPDHEGRVLKVSGKQSPQDIEEILEKSVLLKVEEPSGKSAPHELGKEPSGKSTPQELGKELSGKSTPQELQREPSGKSTPHELEREHSGKSTPQELPKETSGKSTPHDLEREPSGKATPQELQREPSGKSTHELEREPSGKSTPQELPKETSGKSTPHDLEREPSGKSTPQELQRGPSGKSTPHELEREPSGKSTPKELGKEPSGKSTPHELEREPSGKATPQELQREPSGKSTPHELEREPSGKSTPQELQRGPSGKSTPHELEREPSGKATPQELQREPSGKSTHELEREPSGKSTPKELGKEPSGKSTPHELEREPSGKSTPQELQKEPSGKSTPQELQKEPSGKSTPHELEREPSGKSTPQELQREPSGKATPQELPKETSGKSTPHELEREPSGKLSPHDPEKAPTGKSTPQEFQREPSGKSTPLEFEKELSGKSTPVDKGLIQALSRGPTPSQLSKDVSGKSTPVDVNKELSGKYMPQKLENQLPEPSQEELLSSTSERELENREAPIVDLSEKSVSVDYMKDSDKDISDPEKLSKDISRTATPVEAAKGASGKSSPEDFHPATAQERDSRKPSIQEITQQNDLDGRVATPQDLHKGLSTPDEKPTEISGKSSPKDVDRREPLEKVSGKSPISEVLNKDLNKYSSEGLEQKISVTSTLEVDKKASEKQTTLEISETAIKSTAHEPEEKDSRKSSVADTTGKSTPLEGSRLPSPQELAKDSSGKSTPQELHKDLASTLTPLEVSGKSTPQDLNKEVSRHSTPQELQRELSGNSTPQELQKETSGKATPHELEKEPSGKSTPQDIKQEESNVTPLDVSGKITPQNMAKDDSEQQTSEKLSKSDSGKKISHDAEKEVKDSVKDISSEHEHEVLREDISRTSTPLNIIKETSGKSSPEHLEKQVSSQKLKEDLTKGVSGKSTPSFLDKDELGKTPESTGKATPIGLEKEDSKSPEPKSVSRRSSPVELSKELDKENAILKDFTKETPRTPSPTKDTSERATTPGKPTTSDISKGMSRNQSPEDKQNEFPDSHEEILSSKITPQKISPDNLNELDKHGVEISEKVKSVDVDKSGKSTPQDERDSSRRTSKDMSGKITPESEREWSGKTSRRESLGSSPVLASQEDRLTQQGLLKDEILENEQETLGKISPDIKSGKATPVEAPKDIEERIHKKVADSISDSVSSGPVDKDPSGKSTPHSTDKEISGKVSPQTAGKVTSDSFSLALAEKGTSGTYSLEKESCEKVSSPSPVDISPLSLDELREDAKEKTGEGKHAETVQDKKQTTEIHKTQLERIKYDEGSSRTSTPDRSHMEKSDTSLPNGVESEEECEKGILESERQEKESQIYDISSGEEEELKALEEDEDSEPEIRKGDLDAGLTKEIAKDEKEDINKLVKAETEEEQDDSKSGVKRMLVTASSEDGGTETEICIKSGIKISKEEVDVEKGIETEKEEEKEADFSNLIMQAREEYNARRSRKTSYNSSEEAEEAEEKVEQRKDDVEEELSALLTQARQELAYVRSKGRELQEPRTGRMYGTTKTVTTSETTRMDDDDLITITTILTEEREEQEDGMVKVTTTKETTTKGGKEEGTVVTVNTNIEKKESKKEDEELSQLNSSGDKRSKTASKEEGERTSQEEAIETSRRTSASSIISQEDLVSRKDSVKLEDFRQSSAEMSPLRTTYITSHGDSESLMTSSFYGNLPTEDEMIGKVEHFREFRQGRGYESFTEIGPNGERRERTYFYGRDEDPRGSRDSKSRFVKAYYTEDGQQREEEQSRFVHKYYTSEIPEEESVEKTQFVQRFYTERTSKPDSDGKFRFVETVSEEPIESMDFAKAVDEHMSARGEYLGKEDLSKYVVEKSKPEEEAESSSGSKSEHEKKDVIGDWGRPLGLPLPPKNMNRNYGFPGQNISTTSSLSTPTDNSDSVNNWGQPMNLPSPAPPQTQNGTAETLPGKCATKETPKNEKKIQAKKNISDNKSSGTNTPSRRSESPVKQPERRTPSTGRSNRSTPGHVYMDLTYVPHHGNSYYSNVEFFKKVRARYYVFSGTEPSKEVYNALLEAKQTWENKQLEVTIIPTYDTDVLGYWVAENEEILAKHKIDLSPSASRCTINLQDHETSCSAYRLEF